MVRLIINRPESSTLHFPQFNCRCANHLTVIGFLTPKKVSTLMEVKCLRLIETMFLKLGKSTVKIKSFLWSMDHQLNTHKIPLFL